MTRAVKVTPVPFPGDIAARVLHVPYTFFPDPSGGTEVYVAGLLKAMQKYGFRGAVAAPGPTNTEYYHNDIKVFRFATDPRLEITHAYGMPDSNAAASFGKLFARIQPRIVHLHARTAAVSNEIVDLAHAGGAKVVFTYHTPAVTCVRGSLMWMGRLPCDGRLERRRCAVCNMALHGVPRIIGNVIAAMPEAVGGRLERAGLAGGVFTALRMPSLIAAGHRRFSVLMDKVDCVVAVCEWVADLLRVNGILERKLVLCRQGLVPGTRVGASPDTGGRFRAAKAPLLLGYFGRLDPAKGVDIVITAFRKMRDANIRLEIYGVRQAGSDSYSERIKRATELDPRITLMRALPADRVSEVMQRCDLVVVPSRCLETGPLVVLEAFAAGTPVLGARLGGIAELVNDGVDGILIEPDDPDAWMRAIRTLVENPKRITELSTEVRPPRTIDVAAREMAGIYGSVLEDVGR